MFLGLLSFSVGIYPMHYSIASTIVFSCVVMGISISVLLAEKPSMDQNSDDPPNSGSKWQQPPQSLTPRDRDRGPFYADFDEFHTSEILAIVSSALNWLVATAL